MIDPPRPLSAKTTALAMVKSERFRARVLQFAGLLALGDDDSFWLYLPPLVLSSDVALQAKKAADELRALQNELLRRFAPLVPLLGLSVLGTFLIVWVLIASCIMGRVPETVSGPHQMGAYYLAVVIAGALFTTATTYVAWWLRGLKEKGDF
jgi:hypothetical protein